MHNTLQIAETFTSIQGESHWAGYPCAFIRLAGCNLDCSYCDTRYARNSGPERSIADLVAWAREQRLDMVEVTGGEPLQQTAAPKLLDALIAAGHRVLLETNGSLPLERVPRPAVVILDLKTPGSGMAAANRWENLAALQADDEVKFVCVDRADYEWARGVIRERCLAEQVRLNLSPVAGRLEPARLAAWMIEDRLPARLQVQLHRILWPTVQSGV